jgi:hypothetical protein
MRSTKYIIALCLIFLLFLPVSGGKRPKPNSMKELTDPNSPSYVPIPYPKTRAEIITDLYYYIEQDKNDKGVKEAYVEGYIPLTESIYHNLVEPQSIYRIGKIFKVKNRFDRFADNYTWLIMIMDQDGKIALKISMLASGLMAECGAIGKHHLESASPKRRQQLERLQKVIEDDDIQNILSESLGRFIGDNEIKKMERVAYPSPMGDFLNPIWEIKLRNGTIYYYSQSRDMIYSIDKKIHWKKTKKGYRPFKLSLVPHNDYLPDSISDELVILKKIPRKK